MLVRLRRTGMPTAEVREFSSLLGDGASTHGRRLALLSAHRAHDKRPLTDPGLRRRPAGRR